MIRTLAFAFALTTISVAAFAYSGTDQEQKACQRDVVRHCRTVLDKSELVVLGCLQNVRPKLSASCRAVLESHGQ